MTKDLRIELEKGRGPQGMLLLHGLTGTPGEVLPLAEYLSRRSVRVLVPWLPGHGTNPSDLARTHWTDWAQTALQAYDHLARRCRKVFVGGLSMGALLSLLVGLERPTAGVVSMAAPIDIQDFRFRGLAFFRFFQWWTGQLRGGVRNPQGPVHVTYPTCPTSSLYEMKKLADGVRARLGSFSRPLLILQGRRDSMVPPDNAERLWALAGTPHKSLHYLDRSDHVLPLDYDQAEVFHRVHRFLQTGGKARGTGKRFNGPV